MGDCEPGEALGGEVERARAARSRGGGGDLGRATTAIVLATGADSDDDRAATGVWRGPKALTPVAGTPLITRTLLTLWRQGIESVIVVTGHAAAEIEAAVARSTALSGLEVVFVRDTPRGVQDGRSVLAARPLAGDAPFLLTTPDHGYCGSIVSALRGAPDRDAAVLMAVDRRRARIRNLGRAVRVHTDPCGRILGIGCSLPEYDAIDTGLMLCAPALFSALVDEQWIRGGECRVTDGVRRLARRGRAFAVDIPAHAGWHGVDTLADVRLGEASLMHGAGSSRERHDASS
jgi:choline kinase